MAAAAGLVQDVEGTVQSLVMKLPQVALADRQEETMVRLETPEAESKASDQDAVASTGD